MVEKPEGQNNRTDPEVGASTFEQLHEYLKERTSTVHAVFWEFDKDRSGSIDVHEFQRGMAKLEAPVSDAEAQAVFAHIDAHGNSDGRVQYKELVAALNSSSAAAPHLMGVAIEGLEWGIQYSIRVTADSGEVGVVDLLNLDTVQGLSAGCSGAGVYELSWDPSAGATQYR